jgi:hypothetical protein
MPIAFYYPEHWTAVLAAPPLGPLDRLRALLRRR